MAHPPDAAESELLIRRLKRRLWLERIVALAVIGAGAFIHFRGLPAGLRVCIIAVDGHPTAVVPSRSDAERILREIKAASGLPPEKVQFAQTVTFHSGSRSRNPVQSDAEAIGALSAVLQPVVQAAAVVADGEVVLALPTQDEAVRALSMLLREFAPADSGVRTFFKEQVKVDMRLVPVDRLVPSARAAVERIVRDAAPSRVHRVKAGDTAWKIAAQYDVQMSRLQQANPGVDLSRLRIGDKVKIPGKLPPVTVIARREIEETVGEGPLTRTQLVRITYENGVEVRREVIARRRPSPPPQAEAPREGRNPYRWRDEVPQ
jgi:LysM repeat protein